MSLLKKMATSAICLLIALSPVKAQKKYGEAHRLQLHFSPQANWMNDPNGMVYHNGIYHLFFQYYPGGSKWGPMHWGHATSTNLVHWKEQPIALYPDSLGYIFSGSAVVDKANTAGFGKNGQAPLVAIFTHHDTAGERRGEKTFQNQSLAYSLDNGATWTKYSGNPVLKNPGIVDFRDPKVMWYEPQKKWIMTLAAKDRIAFYASPDLKNWTAESEFGAALGAHGGVWECPDLFQLDHNGKKVWVLLVNINPGGPNGGSATQYFIGDFDGKNFTAAHKDTRWLDWGPDEYAGITWTNTGDRKIFLGWMSNWMYANEVPTHPWRSANTVPRDLKLKEVGGELYVASMPSKELNVLRQKAVEQKNVKAHTALMLDGKAGAVSLPCRIDISMDAIKDFSLRLSNDADEAIIVGYNADAGQYFIDRSASGKKDFHKDFAARHTAPRIAKGNGMNMTLIVDVGSVELFADDGLSVMSSLFFPSRPYHQISIQGSDDAVFKTLRYARMKSIWPK